MRVRKEQLHYLTGMVFGMWLTDACDGHTANSIYVIARPHVVALILPLWSVMMKAGCYTAVIDTLLSLQMQIRHYDSFKITFFISETTNCKLSIHLGSKPIIANLKLFYNSPVSIWLRVLRNYIWYFIAKTLKTILLTVVIYGFET